LDGVHRYIKAIKLNNKTIKVRKRSGDIIKQVKRTDEEYRKWI
jgi:hypothetical protein